MLEPPAGRVAPLVRRVRPADAAGALETVPRLVVARLPAALFELRPAVSLLVTFLTSPANVKHFYLAMIAGGVAQFST